MINKTQNTPAFGWHYRMHTTLLNAGLSKTFEKNNPLAVKILREAVTKPDFDEFFLSGQRHFYYPNDKIKSYLDWIGTNNAKSAYKKHISEFLNRIKHNESISAMDYAGRAEHFRIDITNPNHIESGSIIKKGADAVMHHNFEMQTYAKEREFIQNYKPQHVFTSPDFITLFDDTVRISQQNSIPNKNNTEKWDEIAQNGINLAIDSSKRFIELLSNVMQEKNITL